MKASPCVGLFCEVNMRNNLLAAIVSALGGSVTNMNNRNKLLVDIVLAAGGTVTNPNDRNMLLQDWLDAAVGTLISYPIKNIVVFGASIMEYTFETSDLRDGFEQEFKLVGENVKVYEHGKAGDDSAQMLSKLPSILDIYEDAAQYTLVLAHWGGNDLIGYPGNSEEVTSNLRAMCELIKSKGFIFALSNTTYRLVPPYHTESAPFNAAVQQPLVDEFADIPLDMYSLTFDNQGTWFMPDGIHPTAEGIEINQEYLFKAVSPHIANDIVNSTNKLRDFIFSFGENSIMDGGLNSIVSGGFHSNLYSTDYALIDGGVININGFQGITNQGRGNTADPSNASLTMLNNAGLLSATYGTADIPLIIDFKLLNIVPEDSYTVQVTGSRVATEDRISVYTIGSKSASLNTSLNPPQFIELQVSGDELLNNKLECVPQAGTEFAYISMIRIINNSL